MYFYPHGEVSSRHSRTRNSTLALLVLTAFAAPAAVLAKTTSKPVSGAPMPTKNDVQSVSPALESYTESKLIGEVWKRPDLSPRDRSVVTVAALISRSQTIEMPYHFRLALDNGVKPKEVSEIIFHLGFYSGWPNAMAAVMIAKDIFAERGIRVDQLPVESPSLLPIDAAAEEKRATRVSQDVGPVSQALPRLRRPLRSASSSTPPASARSQATFADLHTAPPAPSRAPRSPAPLRSTDQQG
jgi:4-carboxymuconolactone decarboxylase